ncbi:hypothetical protein CO154_02530 [Candidatus Pacearchaeota archaeon CG_4_9_14_3_um_filter_31_7]|nr:MAG: hypothetical protein AUJ10_03290 [Candidatus Pacearchaeota archaeon CG1_02_31_27]PIN92431.1 MAG: hypothetical protein COU55_01350 [Candidatus Pacearchaeota archaeon CG10_big_fil_rev_8_21_14_0_10_31_59]PIZ81016.1 MAG: hypothetical protein COX99_01050 [Candidatus Pacearchaeota archaeon CG_4_10_14_0_2_um_filter_31_10]PJA70512.1 MAG: hypothetical protein CO154_02530 [Candidatus Pacearchaeota archaeon CG_4_9_14_3_um_filter_31_7]
MYVLGSVPCKTPISKEIFSESPTFILDIFFSVTPAEGAKGRFVKSKLTTISLMLEFASFSNVKSNFPVCPGIRFEGVVFASAIVKNTSFSETLIVKSLSLFFSSLPFL